MCLLWLQELIDKHFPQAEEGFIFRPGQADPAVPPSGAGCSVTAFLEVWRVWEQVVLSVCSKQEAKHIGLVKYLFHTPAIIAHVS